MPMNPRLLVPRAATGFDPRRIADLTGWWDAADAASVTLDGGRVATWADKSGLGRNATNSTSGSTQPNYSTGAVNGRNALAFVAADNTRLDLSNIAVPASHTALTVFTRPTAGTHSMSLGSTLFSPNTRYLLQWFTDNVVYQASNATFTTHGSANTTTGTFAVTTRRTGTSGVLVRRNGTVVANVTTGTGVTNAASGNWNVLGQITNSFMTGNLCEIVLYDRALSDGEINTVEAYLAQKWGVTL